MCLSTQFYDMLLLVTAECWCSSRKTIWLCRYGKLRAFRWAMVRLCRFFGQLQVRVLLSL